MFVLLVSIILIVCAWMTWVGDETEKPIGFVLTIFCTVVLSVSAIEAGKINSYGFSSRSFSAAEPCQGAEGCKVEKVLYNLPNNDLSVRILFVKPKPTTEEKTYGRAEVFASFSRSDFVGEIKTNATKLFYRKGPNSSYLVLE